MTTMYIHSNTILPSSKILTEEDIQTITYNTTANTSIYAQYGYVALPSPSNTKTNDNDVLIADKDVNGTWVCTWGSLEDAQQLEASQRLGTSVRAMRNLLLRNTDWSQSVDIPFTTEQRQAWVTYRQALRDITKQPGFPTTVEWPTQPNK